jgi:hypothetical protein
MTITVYHMKDNIPHATRLLLTFPIKDDPAQAESARKFFDEGCYVEAAQVDGGLEDAFFLTQNISDSWSRTPGKGVTVVGLGYHLYHGRQYGYKSSEVGDIFKDNQTGKMFVVARIGFSELPA